MESCGLCPAKSESSRMRAIRLLISIIGSTSSESDRNISSGLSLNTSLKASILGANAFFPIAKYSISFMGLETRQAIKLGNGRTAKSQSFIYWGISFKGTGGYTLHQLL